MRIVVTSFAGKKDGFYKKEKERERTEGGAIFKLARLTLHRGARSKIRLLKTPFIRRQILK